MNKNASSLIFALLFLHLTFARGLAQSAGQPVLQVGGEVLTPLQLTPEDLAEFPGLTVTATDRDGKEHQYRGVALHEILRAAGTTLGDQLRGENLAKYVLVQAVDGYEVVFSLAEVDPSFSDKVILLAWEADGKPLPGGEGPYRMVAPGEKKHARWIREIRSIRVAFDR